MRFEASCIAAEYSLCCELSTSETSIVSGARESFPVPRTVIVLSIFVLPGLCCAKRSFHVIFIYDTIRERGLQARMNELSAPVFPEEREACFGSERR